MSARPDVLEVDARDGLRLHVERFSAARSRISADDDGLPTLVLLHGFTSSSQTWATLRDELRDRCDIVTVDLPGHGKSSAPADPARYALDRFADDLMLVLDTLGAVRVVLLGYSLGGRAALKFALKHQARLDALILESASPGIEEPNVREERVSADEELAQVLERDGVAAFVDRWERLPLWATQAALPADTRARIRERRLAQSPTGLANALRGAGAGRDPSVLDRLGGIRVPVQLIAGAKDLKYVDLATQMAARIPRARVEIVPDTGHAVHVERQAEYARIVERFLASLSH